MCFIFRAVRAFMDPEMPENFFRAEVNILRAYGIEMLEEETWAYTVYSRTALFLLVYCFTLIEATEVYFQWGKLSPLMNVITYLFTHIGGVVKVTLLFYNRKKFGKIFRLFHTAPFAPDNTRGGRIEEQYVREGIRLTETQLAMYLGITSITVISGGYRSAYARIFGSREDGILPYVPMTSAENADTPLFELCCLYQFWYVCLYAILIVTVDVLLCCIMAQLSVQFKILNNAFENIRSRSVEMHEKESPGRDEGECLKIICGEYIDHHCKVLQLAVELEELLNILILAATSMNTALLCFLLYQCSTYPIGSGTFLQNFSYYWIIVCQMSMYCYWGEEVTGEAENVSSAVGVADWPGAPLSVAKALVLVIGRSQKPLFMTMGKFFPLSMSTLMSILKGSFSYFTVIRQTRQVEE